MTGQTNRDDNCIWIDVPFVEAGVEKEGELEYCYKQILLFEPAHPNQALRKYHSKIIILFRRRCNRLKKEEGGL